MSARSSVLEGLGCRGLAAALAQGLLSPVPPLLSPDVLSPPSPPDMAALWAIWPPPVAVPVAVPPPVVRAPVVRVGWAAVVVGAGELGAYEGWAATAVGHTQ